MRALPMLGLVIALVLLLPATAAATVRLTYNSSGEWTIGSYANPGRNEVTNEKVEYELQAKVTLRKAKGRGWVGSGRLIWTHFSYEGWTCLCEGYSSGPLKASLSRPGRFTVPGGVIRFGRGGRLRAARLTVDPGLPALYVVAPPHCERVGWRVVWPGFYSLTYRRCDALSRCDIPGGTLPVIADWRRKGGVLRRSQRGTQQDITRYPRRRWTLSDSWKLSGKRR